MNSRFEDKLIKMGQKIKTLRKSNNINIKELAILTQINKSYLYKIEQGKAYGININHITTLAKILKVKPHEIIA